VGYNFVVDITGLSIFI